MSGKPGRFASFDDEEGRADGHEDVHGNTYENEDGHSGMHEDGHEDADGAGRRPDGPPRIPPPRASVEDTGLPLPEPAAAPARRRWSSNTGS